MLYAGLEITIGQSLQLFHQFFALAVGHMLGEEKRVDQKPQLGIGKIPDKIEIRPDIALFQLSAYSVGNHADGLAVFDLIAALHQANDVAAYGFALHVHVILRAQNIHDVLLTEPVLSIGVTA